MRTLIYLVFIIAALAIGCKEKSHEHDHNHDSEASDAVETSENQVLYEEVMKVHDDAMAKMDQIYRKKEELKNKIASTPNMAETKKKEIDALVVKLDSASEGMMDWMHKFNPIPDSLGEEKAREYLETEIEKVKKVRENILQALKEADEEK
jgi:hypothetical protein